MTNAYDQILKFYLTDKWKAGKAIISLESSGNPYTMGDFKAQHQSFGIMGQKPTFQQTYWPQNMPAFGGGTVPNWIFELLKWSPEFQIRCFSRFLHDMFLKQDMTIERAVLWYHYGHDVLAEDDLKADGYLPRWNACLAELSTQ